MASERGRQILLGAFAVVLALVVAYQLRPSTATTGSSASNGNGRTGRAAQGTPQPAPPDVHIEALTADRPKPEEVDRDLFKFKPKAPPLPPRPSAERPATPPAAQQPAARPGPPPLPPISLKFIGYIEGPDGRKIASLSDGVHLPLTAVEGQTVLGQYKIWRIGVESLDISYLDGRGRQTIRMTGQ